ncbi:MAG: hypothetical protein QOG72_2430 [Sphingomonadales bacterium]|nr:hypothetical protein [Sphingomonadales bacterium]
MTRAVDRLRGPRAAASPPRPRAAIRRAGDDAAGLAPAAPAGGGAAPDSGTGREVRREISGQGWSA